MTKLTHELERVLSTDVNSSILVDTVNDRSYSKAEILQKINRFQEQLQQLRLSQPGIILTASGNSVDFVVRFFTEIFSGLTMYAVNPNLKVEELADIAKQSQLSAVILNHNYEDQFTNFAQLSGIDFDEALELPNGDTIHRVSDQETIEHHFDFPDKNELEEQHASLLYTSCTSGRPKAVGINHKQVFAAAKSVIESHNLSSSDIGYQILPLFHVNGQIIALISQILAGGKLVIPEKFSASKFWPQIEKYHITWASAAPAIIGILNKTKSNAAEYLNLPKGQKSLRFLRSASAPLSKKTADLFQKNFGILLVESYGMTEAAGQISVNPQRKNGQKLGSVGLPTVEKLTIRDSDSHQEKKVGEIGEIALSGPSVIQKYLWSENKKDFVDGWLYTGDLGYLDEDNYLFIVGRKKEIINRSGDKISPTTIEEPFRKLSEIDDLVALAIPDEIYGEVPALVVQTSFNDLKKLKFDLENISKNSLSPIEQPVKFFLSKKLIKNAMNKVQRRKIQKQISIGRLKQL